ncbi:decaprenyl-phosphate phosphoribosyltransferase [Marinoscillum furvescens]|uniref:4-hydroxybenzoate polyprenyltransferase n=1 Tax=Marinoscillum furvescens DSM 4134 TaxID=1122208 RepID=A0A3D9L0U6_MARFU|nr:decaprenyl-phosphate phosphoribosyltransferase [Marinoscillum furvescens]RED97073.1 4-hydroxybenzoate polyprenyltransferase [Marinoscillum furvescens DSM 4134]
MRYIFLIRMHHWVKNLFLFVPLFFSGNILDEALVWLMIKGFFSFCLVASAVYILNDLKDLREDRKHPQKKNRPIASGKVPVATAIGVMLVFGAGGLFWAYMLKPGFCFTVLLYLLVNIGYSFGLKHVSLVDVFLVSSGFLIRVVAGGVLGDIFISQWLIIMVFLLALLLTFSKRRHDLILEKEIGKKRRKSCRYYTLDFINTCLSLIAGVIMVSYLMYTFSENVRDRIGENYLYITSVFVFGGILRYLQITLVTGKSGSPTRIFLTDKIIQFTVAGWVLAFFITLYL